MSVVTATDIVSVQAKITADFLLGKIRLRDDSREPQYLYRLRGLLKQIEKQVGKQAIELLAKESRGYLHCLVDALFDQVTGIMRLETVEKLKPLPVDQRVAIDGIIAEVTGKNNRDKRWNDELFGLKRWLEKVVQMSISDLTMQDIRTGFDPYVHKVVDELCDNWQTLVN